MNPAKSVLVIYYSLTGNTERVAKDLARRLDADLESIHDQRRRSGILGRFTAASDALRKVPALIDTPQRDPSQYPIVLIGTPVWAGQMTPAIRAYLQREARRFNSAGFFITSGNAAIATIAPSLQSLARGSAIGRLGLNARELRDPAAYEKKVAAFVQQIRANVMQRAIAAERASG